MPAMDLATNWWRPDSTPGVPQYTGTPGVPEYAGTPGVPEYAGTPGVPEYAGTPGVPQYIGGAQSHPTAGSRVAFNALVSFTVILLLSPQIYLPALKSIRIALLAAGLAIAAHLLDSSMRRRPIARFSPEVGVATALVAWSLITIPLSYWPGGSVMVLTDHYLKAIAFFWLICTVVTTTDRVKVLAWTFVLCSIPLAATGVNNYLSGTFLYTGIPGLNRIYGYSGGSGLVGNPNDLALMLNLIIPIAAAMLVSARTVGARTLAGFALLLNIVGVVVTFSRAGFLTLAAILLMLLAVLARRRSPFAAAALLAAALLVPPFLPEGYVDRVSTIADIDADETGSAQGRWLDFGKALDIVVKNPVTGVGIGQDILALNQERGEDWTSVHNAYLQYAVDLGVPGVLLFMWLHLTCYRSARGVEKATAGRADPALRDLGHLAAGVQISLVAFAVAAMFHPIAYQFYFFCVGGLAVALRHAYQSEETRLGTRSADALRHHDLALEPEPSVS